MPHVVHIFTVADSLIFLGGQPAFFRARGYELTAICSPSPALTRFGQREQVAVHPISMPRRISPVEDAASVARMVALLRQLRPDIVHAHTPKGGLLGMIAATLAGVPVRIYHMRGLPLVTAQGVSRAVLTLTERTSCALASRVIAVSASLRDVAVDARLCNRKKIAVLASGSGNGVDCVRFDPDGVGREGARALRARLGIAADAPVVGFVGRLVRDKGVSELLDAFRQVRRANAAVHLLVAGVFEARDPVPPDVRIGLENDPQIHLLGFVEDTSSLYAAIDVLALPTYREGFPNVPLEAASMRVPVVTTRVPGCVDAVVDSVTGLVVPVRDAGALANAINIYLADASLREAHGRAGRTRVEKTFRRERIWEALADVYDDLLGRTERVTPSAPTEAVAPRNGP